MINYLIRTEMFSIQKVCMVKQVNILNSLNTPFYYEHACSVLKLYQCTTLKLYKCITLNFSEIVGYPNTLLAFEYQLKAIAN